MASLINIVQRREEKIKGVIGRAVGFGAKGLDTFLGGAGELLTKKLSKVAKKAKKIRVRRKAKLKK